VDDNDLQPLPPEKEELFQMFFAELIREIEVLHKHIGFIYDLSPRLSQEELTRLVRPWI
jgi:hypothetical protein